MNSNPSSGAKIIVFADTLKIILIVLAAIEGLVAIFSLTDAIGFFLALLIAIAAFGLGFLFAIITNILLRGYGELILSAANIESMLRDGKVAVQPQVQAASSAVKVNPSAAPRKENVLAGPDEWRCSCGRINKNYVFTCACGNSRP